MSDSGESDTLIVGGGLAGLALATYLRRQGREPLLVEQAADWRGGGYGIGLWSNGLAVLAELGRLDTAREHAADPDGFETRASDGHPLTRTTLPPEQTLLLAIHRADLHAALREDVPPDWIRMGTSPERIDERADEVVVAFEDGTAESFDLAFGVDGAHSTVQEQCGTDADADNLSVSRVLRLPDGFRGHRRGGIESLGEIVYCVSWRGSTLDSGLDPVSVRQSRVFEEMEQRI